MGVLSCLEGKVKWREFESSGLVSLFRPSNLIAFAKCLNPLHFRRRLVNRGTTPTLQFFEMIQIALLIAFWYYPY